MPAKLTEANLVEQGFSKTFLKRFWIKVIFNTEGCWGWIGTTDAGYGWITRGPRDGGHILAHRASWMIHFGPIPEETCVLHKCDNRLCCRPQCLFLGDRLVNNRDMVAKGRHGNTKFTWEQVNAIRNQYESGLWTYQGLATAYGRSKGAIAMILTYRNWKTHKPI